MTRPKELPTTVRRSKLMAKVKRGHTGAELRVRRALRELGVHYRLHAADLPGKPDIVHRRDRWVIFVNGCFWHFHQDCKRGSIPKRNREFWQDKLEKNRRRDWLNIRRLMELGFSVLVVWECETRDPVKLREILKTFFS